MAAPIEVGSGSSIMPSPPSKAATSASPEPLWPATWPQEEQASPGIKVGRVGAGVPCGSVMQPGGSCRPLSIRDLDLALGHRAHGCVENQRRSAGDRHSERPGTRSQKALAAAPGGDAADAESDRPGRNHRDESFLRRFLGVFTQPADVSGVPNCRGGDAILPSALHRPLQCKRRRELADAAMGVNDGRRGGFTDDRSLSEYSPFSSLRKNTSGR